MKRILHFAGVVVLVAASGSILLPDTLAAPASDRTRQKEAAEAQRAQLRQKLAALKREIDQTEAARSDAASALAASEAAISQANRALYELEQERREVEARIAALAREEQRLAKSIDEQRQRVASILREQHRSGSDDRLRLLLSGDDPNRISRELQYMGYVWQAQARVIDGLRDDLARVEKTRAQAQNARSDLKEIEKEQQAGRARLEREKARHATLVAELSSKLAEQRKEAGNIERDQQRLSELVVKLGRLIEAQRKAEAEARERRRQEQLAHERATPESSTRNTPPAGSGPIDNGRKKVFGKNELTPERSVQAGVSERSFGSLRGQLRLPVRGELLARYGMARSDGPSWKGLFIRTAEGEEVRAVADGEVVFADWLRGFGNLIIIDHGGEYMTIYGNNQALLKHAGDQVRTGDVISTAGSSGGSEHSGLYFEMRHQGRTFDPITWISAGSIK